MNFEHIILEDEKRHILSYIDEIKEKIDGCNSFSDLIRTIEGINFKLLYMEEKQKWNAFSNFGGWLDV